jgi:hypothetical protein
MAVGWALVLALFLAAGPAAAACRVDWDCTKGYPCTRVETCDNVFQNSPVPPAGVQQSPRVPATPPVPPSAIPRSVVPPFGKSSCSEAYLCTPDGKCAWQTRCQ